MERRYAKAYPDTGAVPSAMAGDRERRQGHVAFLQCPHDGGVLRLFEWQGEHFDRLSAEVGWHGGERVPDRALPAVAVCLLLDVVEEAHGSPRVGRERQPLL